MIIASPTPTVSLGPLSFCGQWDSLETGVYTVYNNLWGQEAGKGSQCTSLDGLAGDSLAWSTEWSWSEGEYNAKSFAKVVSDTGSKQISAISSIHTSWEYSYTGDDMVANVAYDIFTSSTAAGFTEYEIMIWLAALGGAGPISSAGRPIANTDIAGTNWDVYDGFDGDMHIFSFLSSSQISSFDGDLVSFISYLTSNQGLPASQYVVSIGAGTEPFVGSGANMSTTAYVISMN
ncbi:family 12 glycosyl hydrolase [Xylaria nigripes]|nr:family 12 glycosyl hydrolase [Xylaria nigripes]